MDNEKTIDWTTVFENFIPESWGLILTGIAFVLWYYRKEIIVWLKKRRLMYLPVNFNMALSLDFNEGLNSGVYFEQIKKNLNGLIDKTGLSKQIVLNDFSDIHRFNNKEEAESFRNKKGIDLVLWGEFTNDNLKKDGEVINEISLHFTFGHPDDKEKTVGKMILLDISSSLAKKTYWKIVDSNSLEDTRIVSNNIFDTSTYIIALTLKISGRLNKSLALYEQLYSDLLKRGDEFKNQIKPHLYNIYEILIIEIGINKKNYPYGKELCDKLLSIAENDFFALSNLALFECMLENEDRTEELVEILLELYPNIPVTELDVAYIRILQKNYSNAFKHYEKLFQMSAVDFRPQEVVEFLGGEYDKRKDPAFLFGVGIISYKFGDPKLARDYLSKFLKKANVNKYKPMCRKAKKIVREIKL